MTTERLRPLAALALVALLAAGCGSDAPAETSTVRKPATGQAKAVKFAECIRSHGVPHFPDPNAKGEYVFGIDVTPAVWQKAVHACKALEPPGALSSKRSPKQQTASLRFAQCIRENGVKDFPDPVNGEPLVDTTKIPSSDKPGGMTILNAAMQHCRRFVEKTMAGR